MLIGSGGKTVKAISEKFGVQVNFDDDGTVTIYSKDKHAADQAKQAFQQLLEEPEIGATYQGVVKRIVDFGAFIEFLPGKEGLCHISKMSTVRINKVEDVLLVGQEIEVKIIEIDKMGRVNLSLLLDAEPAETRRQAIAGGQPRSWTASFVASAFSLAASRGTYLATKVAGRSGPTYARTFRKT